MTNLDVFFFSCGESYADLHFKALQKIIPGAKRIDSIKGTPQAWAAAASLCSGEHFFSVDADNLILPDFTWSIPGLLPNDERVHVWRCKNIVNQLVYGHGALKLWSAKKILEEAECSPQWGLDFTAHMSKFGFVIQPEVASLNCFNFSPFDTFSAALKECYKLSLQATFYVGADHDPDLADRLRIWASTGRGVKFGEYSMIGARVGIRLGLADKQSGQKRVTMIPQEIRQQLFEKIECVESALDKEAGELSRLGFTTEGNKIPT
jgi:hypothetical protein